MRKPEPIETDVFQRLSEKEKIDALHSMIAYLRQEQAIDKKKIAELNQIVKEISGEHEYLKGEIKGIGIRGKKEDTLTTSQKINIAFDSRFAFFKPVAQGVLTHLVDFILFAVLALAFGRATGIIK